MIGALTICVSSPIINSTFHLTKKIVSESSCVWLALTLPSFLEIKLHAPQSYITPLSSDLMINISVSSIICLNIKSLRTLRVLCFSSSWKEYLGPFGSYLLWLWYSQNYFGAWFVFVPDPQKRWTIKYLAGW